jgi:K+-sensing histidine kinase KdpD
MSHDLRTPLAAIHVALGLLVASAMDQLDMASADLLFTAQRNTQRLVIMVEDLLALNQLDADVLELRIVPLDLCPIVAEAVRVTSPLFLEKDQEVTMALPAALPAVADARRIEQVVTNVLANAHRHTPSGARIQIAGAVTETEILLTISDDGRGIPPHLLERIFDRHHRRSAGGGSGIGLAAARALMARHGGRLWAENRPEGGAIFFIALPRHGVRQ